MNLRTFAAAAFAAMLTLVTTPAFAQPPVDPWAGLYIGIGGHIGEAFGGNKLSFTDLSTAHDLTFTTPNSDNSMVLGGLQLGQLWPLGGVTLGIEDDVSFGKNIHYIQSLRGILGVPAGSFLIYGTGGIGFENGDEEFTVTSASGEVDTFKGGFAKYGWVAGGGIEAIIAPRLSLGVEALYYGIGSETTPLTTALGGEPFNFIANHDFTVVRARIDYHIASLF